MGLLDINIESSAAAVAASAGGVASPGGVTSPGGAADAWAESAA
jgi:hypothetical protein